MSTWLPYDEYIAKRDKINRASDLPYKHHRPAPLAQFDYNQATQKVVKKLMSQFDGGKLPSTAAPRASSKEPTSRAASASPDSQRLLRSVLLEVHALRKSIQQQSQKLSEIFEAVTESTTNNSVDDEEGLEDGSVFSTPPTTPAAREPPSSPPPRPRKRKAKSLEAETISDDDTQIEL